MADQNADQGARGDEISAPGLAGGGGGGGGANERVMRWGMVVSPSSCGLPVTIDGNTVTNTGPWVANHDRPAQNARKKSILTLFGDKPMIPNTYFELQLHKRCDTHIGVATRDPCFRTPESCGGRHAPLSSGNERLRVHDIQRPDLQQRPAWSRRIRARSLRPLPTAALCAWCGTRPQPGRTWSFT